MALSLAYFLTDDRPAVELWWQDDDGTLIDFSAGYTWTFEVGVVGSAPIFTKTTGIAGAAGAGSEPTGTPNVVITWTAGELAGSGLAAGTMYVCWLTARFTGALDRTIEGVFRTRQRGTT